MFSKQDPPPCGNDASHGRKVTQTNKKQPADNGCNESCFHKKKRNNSLLYKHFIRFLKTSKAHAMSSLSSSSSSSSPSSSSSSLDGEGPDLVHDQPSNWDEIESQEDDNDDVESPPEEGRRKRYWIVAIVCLFVIGLVIVLAVVLPNKEEDNIPSPSTDPSRTPTLSGEEEEEATIVTSTGSTHVYRTGPLSAQSFTDHDTLLVQRSGNEPEQQGGGEVYSLLTFDLDSSSGSFDTSTSIVATLCLHHVVDDVLTDTDRQRTSIEYSICRLPSTTDPVLETMTGTTVSFIMPEDCVDKMVIEFTVEPSDDVVCMDVSQLVASNTSSSTEDDVLEIRKLEENSVLFMIDNLQEEQVGSDQFFPANDGQGRQPTIKITSTNETELLSQPQVEVSPSLDPTSTPLKAPTPLPTTSPTLAPVAPSTLPPTPLPTKSLAQASTNPPTSFPTVTATVSLTKTPTLPPSIPPTSTPTPAPITPATTSPTMTLSDITDVPTPSPTTGPTQGPTSEPTKRPISPAALPTSAPTTSPTAIPTVNPTVAPSLSPVTSTPTEVPTSAPTVAPTVAPSISPVTRTPTEMPTSAPTNPPTGMPTATPTVAPSISPVTRTPTEMPTSAPTNPPTGMPTATPTAAPTLSPVTSTPTEVPTGTPTAFPTISPTSFPTSQPTAPQPTQMPTPVPRPVPVADLPESCFGGKSYGDFCSGTTYIQDCCPGYCWPSTLEASLGVILVCNEEPKPDPDAPHFCPNGSFYEYGDACRAGRDDPCCNGHCWDSRGFGSTAVLFCNEEPVVGAQPPDSPRFPPASEGAFGSPCNSHDACDSGLCAKSGYYSPQNVGYPWYFESIYICCKSTNDVLRVGSIDYCTDLPNGALCRQRALAVGLTIDRYQRPEICASGVCIGDVCVDEQSDLGGPCDPVTFTTGLDGDDEDCKGDITGSCGRASYRDGTTNFICCPSGRSTRRTVYGEEGDWCLPVEEDRLPEGEECQLGDAECQDGLKCYQRFSQGATVKTCN